MLAVLSMARQKIISVPCFQQQAASAALLGWERGRVHVGVWCRGRELCIHLEPGLQGQGYTQAGVIVLMQWASQS